ncbi:MAG: T9SS type A sorting domain-containing protein [Prolixibacteraceae bacterium]|nr:T9SS type A sorting domain-containing protein [Prolixibacteraceae bacterium]
MKKFYLLLSMLCMLTYMANAEGNTALYIYGDGTSFFLSGLEENIVSDLTIEGWVKFDGAVPLDDYTALVDFRDASTGNSKALIFKNSGGITTSYEWNNNWTYINDGNYVPADEWVHVAVVVSGLDRIATFYINGYETGYDDQYSGLGDDLPLGENVRVGAGLGAEPLRTLIGVMDEIRIWTIVRTEEEIFENMNIEIDPASDGLLMYYRCNEESGSDLLTDETGNGYDLPVIGTEYEFVDDTEWCTEEASGVTRENLLNISLYPNPVIEQLHIKGVNLHNAAVKIFDLSGQLVDYKVTSSTFLNVSGLKKGMYLIEINQDSRIYKGKFVKE